VRGEAEQRENGHGNEDFFHGMDELRRIFVLAGTNSCGNPL
jgi:hypothetical protein